MKLREKAQDILNLYNYYTGAIIVDAEGVVEYYYNSMKEINSMKPEEVVGKNVLDIYTNIDRKHSSILTVVRTGKPLFDRNQRIINFKGESFDSVNSTFPIRAGEKIIGAVEIYRYEQPREIQHSLRVEVPKGSVFNLYSLGDIVSESEVMEELKKKIERVAATDSTVLIHGETGTGKELAAQAIHNESRRCREKFIAQNCAAIPGNLLENILFGTMKGSFTDARDKPGLFEVASGGTIFLDEIHAMEWKVQAKLLKAIEEQQIYRLGATEPIPIDVRFIAAVNRDPLECVAEGLLREDLYYRLKVVQLDIPNLKERREDIGKLTEYFIGQFNQKMNKSIAGVSPEVDSFFQSYDWPGNVRELRNIIECAFNFAQGKRIELEDIDCYEEEIEQVRRRPGQKAEGAMDLKRFMKEYEREIVRQVIESSDSMTEAARRLQITKQTLYNKIREFAI